MFAANDGPDVTCAPDRDLSACAVLTIAGTSRLAARAMQQGIFGARR